MKFKAEIYRRAIDYIEGRRTGFACKALDLVTDETVYSDRFSRLYVGSDNITWTFTSGGNIGIGKEQQEYTIEKELGRRTREIALELAAHLEETGEMDKILKGV